jgi:3'-5' exoribonuclease
MDEGEHIMNIVDLKQAIAGNDTVVVVGKINSINESTTRDGQPFISVNIEDLTGSVTGRLWNTKEHTFEKGAVYEVKGTVNEYNSRLQLIIAEYQQIHDESITQQFFTSAPQTKEWLAEKVDYYLSKITDPDYATLAQVLYQEHQEAFLEYPAATQNHHAYLQGLAYHTVTMCDLAERIMPLYELFDESLVYAGILLHDIAKVVELSDPKGPEYTNEGKLLGHLVLGAQWVQTKATQLAIDSSKSLLLQHLIISHHGRREWGSAQVPQTAEAELLFFIDNLDSKMESVRIHLGETPEGEWTKRIPVLDGRSLFNHKKR